MTAALDYAELWEGTAPAARRYAASLVPEHAADEVVSEAFTRIISAVQRGSGPRQDPRPYLMASVRNQARDYNGRQRRLVPVAAPEPREAVTGPQRAVERREEAALALRAFRQLPERWQRVLWATAVEERSAAELGRLWGIPPNAVSQLASRAREGLRQAYLNEHARGPLPPACAAVAPYLGAAVRGRAGRRRQAELAAHLRRCRRCADVTADLARINTGLGELLVPGAAALGAARLLSGGTRRLGRLVPWHTLTAGGLAVSAALGASLVVVATVPPAGSSHLAVNQAAAPAPAASPGATYRARHRRTPPGGGQAPAAVQAAAVTAAGQAPAGQSAAQPAAAAPSCPQPAGSQLAPFDSWPAAEISGLVSSAGSAVAGTGQAVSQAATGVTGDAASAVNSAAATAGSTVSGVTGTVGSVLGGQ